MWFVDIRFQANEINNSVRSMHLQLLFHVYGLTGRS